MMLPTHALVGLAVATPLLVVAPELAPIGLAAALVGSVIPDLDMYAGHRRRLHYPTKFSVLALALIPVGVVAPSRLTVAMAFLTTGAAVHCRMDRYGGGLELRPWEETSDLAVYDHVRRRWRRPRRWIRYDGAPEDVLLLVLVGVPLAFVLGRPFDLIVGAALLVGVTYGLLRRRLAGLVPAVYCHVPDHIESHVPDRYRE